GRAQWQHGEDLLAEERPEGQADVATAAADILLQFQEREVMLDVPEQIGQEEQERQQSGEQYPAVEQMLALGSEQKTRHQREAEDQHGVLGFETQAGEQSKIDPEFLVAGLDDANEEQRAPHPAERLEGVYVEGMIQGQEAGSQQDAQGGEPLGESPSAQFARHGSGEQNQASTSQGGSQ